MDNNNSNSILSYVVIFILIFGVLGVIIYIVNTNDNSTEFLDSLSEGGSSITVEKQAIATNNLTIQSYMRDKMSKSEVEMLFRVVASTSSSKSITIRIDGIGYDTDSALDLIDESKKYKASFMNNTKSDSYESAAYYEDGSIKNIWLTEVTDNT